MEGRRHGCDGSLTPEKQAAKEAEKRDKEARKQAERIAVQERQAAEAFAKTPAGRARMRIAASFSVATSHTVSTRINNPSGTNTE